MFQSVHFELSRFKQHFSFPCNKMRIDLYKFRDMTRYEKKKGGFPCTNNKREQCYFPLLQATDQWLALYQKKWKSVSCHTNDYSNSIFAVQRAVKKLVLHFAFLRTATKITKRPCFNECSYNLNRKHVILSVCDRKTVALSQNRF